MDQAETIAAIATLNFSDSGKIFGVGIEAIRHDLLEAMLPTAEQAVRHFPHDAKLWQLLGLVARGLNDSARAISAFATAAALAPNDALIAHSHARVMHEAGGIASELYEKALILAPQNGEILLGRAAALVTEHEIEKAVGQLATVLKANPLWLDGHRSIAKIRGQVGDGSSYTDSLKTALLQMPDDPSLHQLLVMTNFQAKDFGAAAINITNARLRFPDLEWIAEWEAYCASESGDMLRADKLFHSLGMPENIDQAHRIVRHHIKAGRADLAAEVGEAWIERDLQGVLWPYLALAWRITGDSRWQWLEGDPRFIGVYDLCPELGDISKVAAVLRDLHFADRQPLDQSLRFGTQTDGPLFSRVEPEIKLLRDAVINVVEQHIAQLPGAQAGHPLLVERRKPIRFAGSWSVRLTRQGMHVDHVHPEGWLSSALYISLPAKAMGDGSGESAHDGWLSFGENRELVPDLEPFRMIEPKEGRLVLFPSTMWHGTRKFDDGERLTVAFDIARPARA